jgi:diguanylate cyclase (GGDEF)-like protein
MSEREAIEGELSLDASLLPGLISQLAASDSGIAFIYSTLSQLVSTYGLSDAVLVLDEPTVGRQVFRAGRQPLYQLPGALDPLTARPGIHAFPPLPAAGLAGSVTALCSIALQLDLSRHDASHDPLTGLYNRRSFDVMLQQSALRSARYGWKFALAIVDVNRFKVVNDQLGHAAGDRILRSLGAHLRSSLRGGDAAARIGGDEFALLIHDGDQRAFTALIARVQSAVALSVGFDVGFAWGLASAPEESSDPDTLYRLADRRLYKSKQ